MNACVKKCQPADVIFLEDSLAQYIVLSEYRDYPHPDFLRFGPGHIEVANVATNRLTQLLRPDLERVQKIIKAKSV